jgi:hypothetical protein
MAVPFAHSDHRVIGNESDMPSERSLFTYMGQL